MDEMILKSAAESRFPGENKHAPPLGRPFFISFVQNGWNLESLDRMRRGRQSERREGPDDDDALNSTLTLSHRNVVSDILLGKHSCSCVQSGASAQS